jgi:hypothetical protein
MHDNVAITRMKAKQGGSKKKKKVAATEVSASADDGGPMEDSMQLQGVQLLGDRDDDGMSDPELNDSDLGEVVAPVEAEAESGSHEAKGVTSVVKAAALAHTFTPVPQGSAAGRSRLLDFDNQSMSSTTSNSRSGPVQLIDNDPSGSDPSSGSSSEDEASAEIARRAVQKYRRREAKKVRPEIHTVRTFQSAAAKVSEYTGKGGTAELNKWTYEVERAIQQLRLRTFEDQQQEASFSWSHEVYDWYVTEKERRQRTGVRKYYIDNWANLLAAFRRHFESRNDDDDAVELFHGAGMDCHKGESVDVYMLRMTELRRRLPTIRTSESDFVEKLLNRLAVVYSAVAAKARKQLREYRVLNNGEPLPLHDLREIINDEARDLQGQSTASTSAPLAAASAAAAELAGLREQLAQSKRDLKGERVKVAALSLGLAGPPGGALKLLPQGPPRRGPDRIPYTTAQLNQLKKAHRCFNCGDTDHISVHCSKKVVDMRAELLVN